MEKRVSVLAILIVFSINLVSSMNIDVSSPVEGTFYNSTSVNVNVDFGESVNWQAYHNDEPEWNSQGASINNFLLNAIEGLNTLKILASNISNSSTNINRTITFYVDTSSPIISSQTPENNSQKYRGNITFSVSYTEVNLNYTNLYWKTTGNYNETSVTNCGSGSCSKIIDFSSYIYGTNISYYFSLTDKTSKYTNSSVYTFKIVPCITSWNCTEWSACSRSTQTRTCTKICENGTDMPSVSQGCTCTPSWNCDSWSSCSGSTQTRTCTDTTGCEANRDESQSCSSDSDSSSTESTSTEDDESTQNINYFLSEPQLNNGSLRILRRAGDKITFKIKNESHYLELRSISTNKVSIKISSSEQYADLTLDEMKKFDLTADGYYDVSVSLKKLNSSEVGILLNATNEKVPETVAATNPSDSVTASAEVTGDALTALTEEADGIESNRSDITGGFLGAFKNMKETPPYLLVSFILIILGLLSITISKLIRKKKRRKKGYYK